MWVHFYPTVDQQKSCDSCDDKGMNGDLVVVYDVNRDISLGDIKVHHEFLFSPNDQNISYALSSSNLTFFWLLSPRDHPGTLFITLLHLIFCEYQRTSSSSSIKVAQCTAGKFNRWDPLQLNPSAVHIKTRLLS